MDIASYVLIALGGIVLAFSGAHGFSNKSITIVSFGVGAVLLVIGGCLYWQDSIWKSEANSGPTVEEKREQRALVVMDSIACDPLIPQVGQPLRVTVKFFNRGRTPAKKLTITTIFEPVVHGGKPNFSYVSDAKATVGMMAPGVEHISTMIVTRSKSTGQEGPLTPELFHQLQDGSLQLFTHGRRITKMFSAIATGLPFVPT